MTATADPESHEPTAAELAALPGPTLLEFGSRSCGICAAAQPAIRSALQPHPEVRHIEIEDGRGRLLGRGYGVKLWPTLVLLRDGVEVGRRVRPRSAAEVSELLAAERPAQP